MLENYEKQQRLEAERRLAKKEKARRDLRQLNRQQRGLAKRAVRDTKQIGKEVGKIIKNPLSFFSVIKGLNLITDWMYLLALLAAIFKDFTDFVFIGPLFFLALIIGFLVSIFIAFMMILGSVLSDGKGRLYHKAIRSYLILISGTAAEMLFGVNLIPIETFSVLIILYLALAARKQAQEEKSRETAANRYFDGYAQEA